LIDAFEKKLGKTSKKKVSLGFFFTSEKEKSAKKKR